MAKSSGPAREVIPPKTGEFLPGAIKKTVLDVGLKHPATVYPIAIGASSGFVGWLFGLPVLYVVALAGILIGPVWAIAQIFFFDDKIGRNYINQLTERQREYERHLRDRLEKGLNDCCTTKGLENYAAQGVEQCKAIKVKLSNVEELLEMKISSGEITFGRFLGAAEQVSLSVLDNLKDIVSLLKSVASINTDYIQERFKILSQLEKKAQADINEEATLKKRLQLREDQLQRVNDLLTKNEEAMTELENISAAVADWHTDGRFADTNFEAAIKRLQELAEQAHEYNNK